MKFIATIISKIQRSRHQDRESGLPENNFTNPTVTITDFQEAVSHEEITSNTATSTAKLSFLYSLTTRWAWGAVAHRCETHPHEVRALEQDSKGDTILHWACFGCPPLYVIQAILASCPDLARIPNIEGFLPLHTACCYRASSDIIRALVQTYPESAGICIDSKSEQGGTAPLHLLCDYGCRVDSLRAVLESPAGVASTRYYDHIYGRRPLQILNERKNMHEFHGHLTELRLLKRRTPNALDIREDGERINQSMETRLLLEKIKSMGFWDKAKILALAEYTQGPSTAVADSSRHTTNTTVIHALTGLKHCPPAVLELASFLVPQSLLQKDKNGELPLHLACRKASDGVIQDLLEAQPRAAAVQDDSGALPLQIYIQRHPARNWNALMKMFVVAFPLSLESFDLDHRLYPILWARLIQSRYHVDSAQDLDALFQSIRSNSSYLN